MMVWEGLGRDKRIELVGRGRQYCSRFLEFMGGD